MFLGTYIYKDVGYNELMHVKFAMISTEDFNIKRLFAFKIGLLYNYKLNRKLYF